MLNQSKIFKALSNEDRFKMVMEVKKRGKMYANEFEYMFFLEQSTINCHLTKLYESGIFKKERVGKRVYYSINVEPMFNLYKEFKDLFTETYSKSSI